MSKKPVAEPLFKLLQVVWGSNMTQMKRKGQGIIN